MNHEDGGKRRAEDPEKGTAYSPKRQRETRQRGEKLEKHVKRKHKNNANK